MSDDLIRRSDAVAEIYKARTPDVASHQYAELFINAVCRAPSADRPQGEWFMGNRPLEGKFRIFRCSVCGYEPFYKGEPITPTNMTLRYCPNCGAQMKGAEL